MIAVEVVYCPSPGDIDRVTLSLPDGSRLQHAIEASGLPGRHGLELATVSVGIWGRKEPLDALLRERDRVEIYRPLQCDPKEARRLRYKQRPQAKKAPLSGSPPR
jgi:putative ubiquitin-RnfH superfamily antitoxin RatB of RatAB toxin-antitoxin module